jgi:hypothetical protein
MGYHVLYENMKRGEDMVSEFANFIRERVLFEEEALKFLNKNVSKVNFVVLLLL